MKNIISILLFILLFIPTYASDWKEVQKVEIPYGTPVYKTLSDSGKVKYCIYIQGHSVNVSEANAKKFVSGRCRLELVKWYNKEKDAYKYTIRQLKQQFNIDLNQIFSYYGKNKTHYYPQNCRNRT